MNLRLLPILSMLTISAQAMIQKHDTELHRAARANDYATCFGILMKAPSLPQESPVPQDVVASIQRTLGVDSTDATTENVTSIRTAAESVVNLQKRLDAERIARAFKLRTAQNKEGHIARECIGDNTEMRLCKLLDPSNNEPFLQPKNHGPAFLPGQQVVINGQSFMCTSAKQVFNPNKAE